MIFEQIAGKFCAGCWEEKIFPETFPVGTGGDFFFVACPFLLPSSRFRASKAAESRRGKNEIIFPPDPPSGFHAVGEAAAFGAALDAADSLNFRLTRKESAA